MGDLEEDSDTVTNLAAGVFSGTMFQPFYNMERVIDRPVFHPAVDIDNSSDTAGIMFSIIVEKRRILIHDSSFL